MTSQSDEDAQVAPARALSAEEGRALLDERARRFLGMSGEAFRRAWEAGELDVDGRDVLRVAMLLPLAR